MSSYAIVPILPSKPRSSVFEQNASLVPSTRSKPKNNHNHSPVARLFGPSIFEASKLKVMFLGVDERRHDQVELTLPRTYTLTHSDVTSNLTLAISHSVNSSQLQGWSNKLYRDEVVAEWKKVKEKMSLHVHCHISGGHFLLDLCARLRYYIFSKELPVVLKAFVHGDKHLLRENPELEESLVWVYFHSNIQEFNKVECWGPLKEAASPSKMPISASNWEFPETCQVDCSCCFRSIGLMSSSRTVPLDDEFSRHK